MRSHAWRPCIAHGRSFSRPVLYSLLCSILQNYNMINLVRSNEYPALDYGMILDLSNETSQWETFPLLDPPR